MVDTWAPTRKRRETCAPTVALSATRCVFVCVRVCVCERESEKEKEKIERKKKRRERERERNIVFFSMRARVKCVAIHMIVSRQIVVIQMSVVRF